MNFKQQIDSSGLATAEVIDLRRMTSDVIGTGGPETEFDDGGPGDGCDSTLILAAAVVRLSEAVEGLQFETDLRNRIEVVKLGLLDGADLEQALATVRDRVFPELTGETGDGEGEAEQ